MDINTFIEGPHNLIPTSAGCIGLLILLSYVINTYISKSSQLQRKLPPGPKPKALIGNLLDMPPPNQDTTPHYKKLGEKYGPLMSLSLPGQTIIVINKYDIAKELLDKRSSKYSNRPVSIFACELAGFSRGIIFEQPNDNFRQMRKFSHAHIGSPMVLSRWDKEIDVETRRYLLRLLEQPSGFVKHIRNEAASIILRIVYGYQTTPSGSDKLVDMIEQVMSDFSEAARPGNWLVDVIPLLRYVPAWMPGAGFKRTAQMYHDNLSNALALPFTFVKNQMEKGTAHRSMVATILEQGNINTGKPLTEDQEELATQISFALYAGGADTTVATMEVFFLAMLQYPHVLQKAQAEIDQVLGTSRLPGPKDIERLPYCEAVLRELLRWNPIAETIMPHVSSEDDEYNGYHIPKNSMILANFMLFCRDPDVYRDPNVFNPERFLGPNPEKDIYDMTWGFGKRVCPGRFLANQNLWLEMSRTMACFNIKPVGGVVPKEEFTVGFLRRPLPFDADITVRGPAWVKLIKEVEITDPLPEKGDEEYL